MQNDFSTRILIVNDDGVNSDFTRTLAKALSAIAAVYVFVPECEQSGVSQAFTVRKPIRINKVSSSLYNCFSVSGTPADCAKFAIGHFSKFGACGVVPSKFDVCFSGINVGENSGVSSLYSGTVAGAREAALWGVPAIALSLRGEKSYMLNEAINFAMAIVKQQIYKHILIGSFWNVNFPKTLPENFLGYCATKMATNMFTDHYIKVANNSEIWTLDGDKIWNKTPQDSDDFLLDKGYATITPHRIDQTDYDSLNLINKALAEGDFVNKLPLHAISEVD